ncbi:MAG: ANTAR domain-containing protein [Oscillospiraceae bacterium]
MTAAPVELGVFCAAWAQLQSVLPQLFAACGAASRSRSEYAALRGKLDDARLINRAKLLLISRLKMSEDEAHRFLERSAMDGCMKLRTVAESIIRTYEE